MAKTDQEKKFRDVAFYLTLGKEYPGYIDGGDFLAIQMMMLGRENITYSELKSLSLREYNLFLQVIEGYKKAQEQQQKIQQQKQKQQQQKAKKR